MMKAVTVRPGVPASMDLAQLPEPVAGPGELLVDGLAVGVCGTDREIIRGEYGSAPPGRDRLVIGHESLGRVREAPPGSGFAAGDLVAGVVRRPDPQPCGACAHGEFDMCRTADFTERGIKDLDGYAATVWTVESEFAVRLDPTLGGIGVLIEPASVVAKAWEQIEAVGRRSWFEPRSVLVTGAGPIGLLAALLGTQRGLEVHLLDRAVDGPKPDLARRLGATYHTDAVVDVTEHVRPDIVIEATGAGPLVLAAIAGTAAYGITALIGVSAAGRRIPTDAGALNRDLVLQNDVVIGSVNANLRHYGAAAAALAAADPHWLGGLITRRVPLREWQQAYINRPDDVKVVLDLQ